MKPLYLVPALLLSLFTSVGMGMQTSGTVSSHDNEYLYVSKIVQNLKDKTVQVTLMSGVVSYPGGSQAEYKVTLNPADEQDAVSLDLLMHGQSSRSTVEVAFGTDGQITGITLGGSPYYENGPVYKK